MLNSMKWTEGSWMNTASVAFSNSSIPQISTFLLCHFPPSASTTAWEADWQLGPLDGAGLLALHMYNQGDREGNYYLQPLSSADRKVSILTPEDLHSGPQSNTATSWVSQSREMLTPSLSKDWDDSAPALGFCTFSSRVSCKSLIDCSSYDEREHSRHQNRMQDL